MVLHQQQEFNDSKGNCHDKENCKRKFKTKKTLVLQDLWLLDGNVLRRSRLLTIRETV